MELKDLTNDELNARLEDLKNQCVPIYNAMKPLEAELTRREQIEYVGKFFKDVTERCTAFTHIKSATIGEYGLRDVQVNKIIRHSNRVEVHGNIKEYNYRYLGEECGEQEWNAAVLKAKDFLEGM